MDENKLNKYIENVIFGWPISAQIDITNQCNLACNFCYADANRSKTHDLSFNELIEILKILENNDIKEVTFSGGEPFLRNDFLNILKYAYDRDFKIHILSNGTLINEKIIKFLLNIDFIEICININGPPELHDHIVGASDTYYKTFRALELLKDNGFENKISLGTMVMRENLRFIYKVYDSLSKKFPKAKDYRFLFPVPVGRGINYKTQFGTANKEFWIETHNELKKIKLIEQVPINIEYGLFMILWKIDNLFKLPDGNYIPFCNAGKRKLIILSNGDVVACNFFRKKEFISGNILHTSISDIWNNKAIKQFRECISQKIDYCQNCKVWTACRGGCKAWPYTIDNSILTNDPRCNWLFD